MTSLPLYAAAITLAATAALHSLFGERRLIVPLLVIEAPLIQRPHVQRLVRLAWHGTSILMLVIAFLFWRAAISPELADRAVILVAGAAILACGLIDGIVTRFKHVGWPVLTIAGALALASQF